MKLTKIAPIFAVVLPILAVGSTGCASSGDEEGPDAANGAATVSAGADFSAAVGALVVEGKKICTAALVDVDAEAKVGPVSARGRQIVFGGACIGKLKNGFTGAAVFVTQKNGLSVSTPIASFDFESQASAGLAVGILSEPHAGTEALPFIGVEAAANAGAHVGAVLQADENGLLVGASAEVHAGVSFALKTQCTSLSFAAQASVAAGVQFSAGPNGVGAALLLKVNGKLHFAAHIDGQCVVKHLDEKLTKIAEATLEAANDVGDTLNSIGHGKFIGLATNPDEGHPFSVMMREDVKAIRLNGQGHISASGGGATCDKIPLLLLGGPCELRPAAGFKKGQLVQLKVNTHLDLFPNGPEGVRVYISTTNDPPAQSSSGGENNGG